MIPSQRRLRLSPGIMKTEKETANKPLLNAYLQASALGITRGLIGLPIEHPLDFIKIKMQASPQGASELKTAKDTYRVYGIKGFYAGFWPSIARVTIKEAYRCPLLLSLPAFYNNHIFGNNGDYQILQKGFTGLSIATIESLATTPFDKFKVWLMTREDKTESLKDLIFKSSNTIKMSYQSWNIVYPRLIVSWVTFLMADEAFRVMARKYHKSYDLPYSTLIGIGIAVGVVNLTVLLPLDMTVTLVQKENPWPNKGFFKTVKSVHSAFGLKTLYTGSRVRMTQYIIQSIINVNLMDKIESNYKKALKCSTT